MSEKRMYTKKLGNRVALAARPLKSRKFHVIVGLGHKWTVVADGNIKATKVFNSRLSAIRFAKEIAHKVEGEVVIHNTNGQIDKRVSLVK